MIEFTKEEISLCKRVAERHRKEIERGDWVLYGKDEIRLAERIKVNLELNDIIWIGDNDSTGVVSQNNSEVTPLWTISDCLEFLKARIFYGSISDVGSYYEAYYKKVIVGENDEDLSIKVQSGTCKTPLEACLKAVLAVLEGGQ